MPQPPCKIQPDVFVAIDDLLHPGSAVKLANGRSKVLMRIESLAAMLTGSCVTEKGIDAAALKAELARIRVISNSEQKHQAVAAAVGASADFGAAITFIADAHLQPADLVDIRLVPSVPKYYVPNGPTSWDAALQATAGMLGKAGQGNWSSWNLPIIHAVVLACSSARCQRHPHQGFTATPGPADSHTDLPLWVR